MPLKRVIFPPNQFSSPIHQAASPTFMQGPPPGQLDPSGKDADASSLAKSLPTNPPQQASGRSYTADLNFRSQRKPIAS